jgi:hypothetical protein
MPRWPAYAVVAALTAGCGTKPLAAPDPLRVREPGRSVQLHDTRTGLRFSVPLNWVKRIRTNPGIFRVASGAADVSGWAYPRAEKLPQTHAELETARHALIAEAQRRAGGFKLASSAITHVHSSPAIELRGTQEILGRPIRTHSIHVYRPPGEYVFEALAPASSFAIADRKVLAPLVRSLKFRQS